LNLIIRLSGIRRCGQAQDLPLQFVFRFIEICSIIFIIFWASKPARYSSLY
jgi:hypothetical protein